nr:SpoIVB peptidase [Maliibacterium massiliense]
MKHQKWKRNLGRVLALAVVLINQSPYVQGLYKLPDEIRLLENNAIAWSLPFGVQVDGVEDSANVLNTDGTSLKSVGRQTYQLAPENVGTASAKLSLFGVIPLKEVSVSVLPKTNVMPGGQALGIALYTQGALVVGGSDILTPQGERRNPAQEAGMLSGDIITHIDNTAVKDADHLSQLVNRQDGQAVNARVLRGSEQVDVSIQPVVDAQDGKYRMGLWVRDSTAGIGTLSYYDASNQTFAALGHGIMDPDTQSYLVVKNGLIMHTAISDVRKGVSGTPGELHGTYSLSETPLGDIRSNNQFGIYGKSSAGYTSSLYPNGLPIGLQSTTHIGKASILCAVEGEAVQEYACEITRITPQSSPAPKSMVIKITDTRLLEKTGGIVQGMSGSPILQDGRMIGAVTHVFINDPTRGYGVYLEWMLEESDKIA